MRSSVRHLVAFLCVGAGTACTGWDDAASVAIEIHPASPVSFREGSLSSLESGYRFIRVQHVIRVPDACRELTGDLAGAGGVLTLRVISHPGEGDCPSRDRLLAYTATIEGLRPGRYNLRVVHGHAHGRSRPEVVLDHPIVVSRHPIELR